MGGVGNELLLGGEGAPDRNEGLACRIISGHSGDQ